MRIAAGCLAAALLAYDAGASAQWRYKYGIDALTDQSVVHATTRSINTHQFSFPYKGGTRAYLSIRRQGDGEPDIMFVLDRGQVLCAPDCEVRLRFDDETEALDYRGTPPTDGSTDMLFIGSEAMLIERLRSAKRLRVEVTVFQEGRRVFDFAVDRLIWPPPPRN